MNLHAFSPRCSRRPSWHSWLAGWLCAASAGLAPAPGLHAADTVQSASSSSVDHLISKLPDPSNFNKSPLESAVQDPAENTPEYQRIKTELQRRDFGGALRDARALAARYPDSHPPVHFIHGLIALLTKQYGEADKAFHVFAALTPTRGGGWVLLASVQFQQRHFQEALADARKSVAVEPSLTGGWLTVAGCEFQLHHLPEAVAAARKATQTNPRATGAWYALGRCEIAQHKFEAASGDFRRAADLSPDVLPIQGALGLSYIEAGRTADAIPPLERIVSKAPNDVVAATKLAYCYMVTGKAGQGADVCRRAVKVQPKYAAAWDMLGQCYRRTGKNREAADAFQHAVNLAPGDLNVRAHLDETRQASPAPART